MSKQQEPSGYDTPPHPLADLFPMLGQRELQELADDIKANGLRHPIIRHEGKVLDGRNRLAACKLAGVEPRFEDFKGPGSAIDFVISTNLRRRHLDESQRAMIAGRVAKMKLGDNQHRKQGGSIEPPSKARAAELLNVGVATVKRAEAVIRKGTPELVAAVDAGEIAVSAAAKVADLPPPRQAEEVKKAQERKQAPPRRRKKSKKKLGRKPPLPKDGSGDRVPEGLRAVFANDRVSLESQSRRVADTSAEARRLIEWLHQNFSRIPWPPIDELGKDLAAMTSAARSIESLVLKNLPFAVCPRCKGSKCPDCRQSGWVPQWRYEELLRQMGEAA